MNKNYTLIIPNYNSDKTLKECLGAILKITHYDKIEIIICDNMSTDKSLSIIKKFPFKLLENKKNQSAGYTRNYAATKAKNEYIVFVDSDIIVPKNLIEIIDKDISQYNFSCITGIFSSFNPYNNFYSQYKSLYANHKFLQIKENVLNSGIMVIKKNILIEVGMFDEDLKHSEDDHLSLKLIKNNHSIYLNKKLCVDHYKYFNFWSLIKNDYVKTNTLTGIYLNKISERKYNSNISSFTKLYINSMINIFIISLTAIFSILFIYNLNKYNLFLILLLFLGYSLNNINFYIFTFKKKGIIFSIKTILFNPFNFIVVSISSLHAVIKFLLSKILK